MNLHEELMFITRDVNVELSRWILPAPCISESCIKKNLKIFIFTFLDGAWKGFMKAFKAFLKPFEVPQSGVEIKI